MDSFPRFGTQPLRPDEITRIAAAIEGDVLLNRPLASSKDPGWRSHDLGIGTEQIRPTATAQEISQEARARKTLAEHFDTSIQDDAFEFVGSDARVELALTTPLPWIRIRGIRRTLFHFQLFGAFWLLLQERGPRRGTIQADMMGLGKVCHFPRYTPPRAARRDNS